MSKPAEIEAMMAYAEAEFGGVDILVNNAFHTGTMTPFEKDDLETGWRDTHEVNLWGTLRMTQAVLPIMKKQKSGSIINVVSMKGKQPPRFRVYMTRLEPKIRVYADTPASLTRMTPSISRPSRSRPPPTCSARCTSRCRRCWRWAARSSRRA